MAKKNSPYFDDFINMIKCSVKASKYLKETLNDFDPSTLSERCDIMHQIENEEDSIKHEMMNRLTKEFIPPIDREDIILMSNELDNITDKIEDVILRMLMYNVQSVRADALVYADIICRCCEILEQAVTEFPNFKKSSTLKSMIIEINTIEEDGDRLYMKVVRDLFKTETNPIEIFSWSKLFDLMEDSCDACEHVANVMESVMMKNA